MAIDESSFYNILGEEITRSVIVQEMIDYYALKLEVGETRVTDFNEGSEIRNLLEAYAVDGYTAREEQTQLSSVAFIETAEGEWLDKHGAEPYINLPREVGTIASGMVTFTLSSPSETDISIPSETILTCTDNDMDYATDSEIIIGANETTANVMCSCLIEGYDGNCPANTITIISDDNVNIPNLSVTNTSAFTGGIDYEEDDEYRQRLLDYVQRPSFGSYDYYVELGEEVTGVHDILLTDDSNDKTAKILINGTTKPTSSSVISDVTETFSIPNNIVLGHTFTYDKPNYLQTKLKVTCTTSQEIPDTDIQDLLQYLFDGGSVDGYELEGLSIGETLTRDSVNSTLELLDDILTYSVDVKYYNGSSWDTDWATFTDKTPATDTVLKLEDVTVDQTVTS